MNIPKGRKDNFQADLSMMSLSRKKISGRKQSFQASLRDLTNKKILPHNIFNTLKFNMKIAPHTVRITPPDSRNILHFRPMPRSSERPKPTLSSLMNHKRPRPDINAFPDENLSSDISMLIDQSISLSLAHSSIANATSVAYGNASPPLTPVTPTHEPFNITPKNSTIKTDSPLPKYKPKLLGNRTTSLLDTKYLWHRQNLKVQDLKNESCNQKKSIFYSEFSEIKKIGQGCFFEAFRARHWRTNQLYAIKCTKELFRGKSDRAEYLREVQLVSRLDIHENVLTYYRAWQEELQLFMQMELCVCNLRKFVKLKKKHGPLQESLIWNWILQLSKGLAHVHAGGVVHLDIKPENILVNFESGCQSLSKHVVTNEPVILKLGDFGQARLKGTLKDGDEGDSTYMAPELLHIFNKRLPFQDFGQQNYSIPAKKLKRTQKSKPIIKRRRSHKIEHKKIIDKNMHNTSDNDFELVRSNLEIPKFHSEKLNINNTIVNTTKPYLKPLDIPPSPPSSSRALFSPARLGDYSRSSSPQSSPTAQSPLQSPILSPQTPSSRAFASDIFSFGLLLFKICTDRALPKNGVKWQLIRQNPNILRDHLEKRTPALSSNLISLIMKMVSPMPEARLSARKIINVAKRNIYPPK